VCLPGNFDAIDIYSHMNQAMNYRSRTIQRGKESKTVWDLDLPVCVALCEAFGADVRETLPKLQIIHEELFR